MDYRGAQQAREDMNVPCEIIRVPKVHLSLSLYPSRPSSLPLIFSSLDLLSLPSSLPPSLHPIFSSPALLSIPASLPPSLRAIFSSLSFPLSYSSFPAHLSLYPLPLSFLFSSVYSSLHTPFNSYISLLYSLLPRFPSITCIKHSLYFLPSLCLCLLFFTSFFTSPIALFFTLSLPPGSYHGTILV